MRRGRRDGVGVGRGDRYLGSHVGVEDGVRIGIEILSAKNIMDRRRVHVRFFKVRCNYRGNRRIYYKHFMSLNFA